MSSIIEYIDDDGQTIRGIPVVIIADRTALSTAAGSKTDFFDTDGRMVRATPLIVVEDYRAPTPAPGPSPAPSPSPSPSPSPAPAPGVSDGGDF
ncbi:MAG: hypothetical protein KKD97_16520 [Gammaproteobacteria bacterium]|nr:hypothetical protein [Gammaproteobacteria bacterium]